MRVLITYSNSNQWSLKEGWPLAGSVIETDDLFALTECFDDEIILHKAGYLPSWIDDLPYYTDEELAESGRTRDMPADWRELRWVEVYNYYRE